jgi:hypothetical protein
MSSDSNAAIKLFEENMRNYSSNPDKPENYNLYNGLANLAAAVGNAEAKLDIVIQQLAALQQRNR